jgi:Cap4 dsDNA endonuclease
MSHEPDQVGPSEWLGEHEPPEDSGAQTQSRFRFQHECTARSCVGMLVLDGVASVVCEEHEDFIVIYADGVVELVSVKHREESKGPWTFATLCSEGGVRHLYDRWLATGRRARCRVMTNAGVKPGELEAREFIAACQSRQAEQIEPYIEKLDTVLGSQDRDRVREFALVLSIESALPGRPHIAAVNVRDFYWPALEELGLVYDVVEPYYDRVLDLIARANRDQIGERLDLRDALLDPGRFDEAAATDRRIKRRTISRDDMFDAMQPLTQPARSFVAPDPGAPPPPPPSRMQRKLAAGELGPTMIETAVQLRAQWYAFESARRANVPGGDPAFEALRLRVAALAGESESRMNSSEPYGKAMHLDLLKTVVTGRLPADVPFALDDQLLQGLVFQLTDECKVWFSETFDVGAL